MIIKDLDVTGNFNLLPKGTIVTWSGITAPSGWISCDGNNGTPDLRGRFVIGIGQGVGLTNRSPNDKGGEERHTLSVAEIPVHSHSMTTLYEHHRSFAGAGGDDKPVKTSCGDCTGFHPSTDSIGGNQPHNVMPPFYALAYIMKI